MQERPSIKELLACENEVNDGFAKRTEKFLAFQTHALVECEAALNSDISSVVKVKI